MSGDGDSGVGSARSTELQARVERRPAIDVARIGALALVVLGHLSLAVVDRADGEVRGSNLLELRPGWAWVAAAAPMPVFFAAAGWANATVSTRRAARRLGALVGAGAVVVALWSAGVLVATWVNGSAGLIGRGARIATQPLWFLAAYVPLALGGARIAALAHRRTALRIGGLLVVLALLDALRFAGDEPELIGWPGFYLAWGVPWLLGAWWRERFEQGRIDERRTGLALFVGGAAAGAILVWQGGYSPALIDAVPGARSNTTPPTLYTAVAGIAQVGALMVIAGLLDRVGRRWRRGVERGGALAVGVYLWHLSALSACVGVVALGLPVPERLTRLWWLTRPLWWAMVLGVTAALVALAAVVGCGGRGSHVRSPPARGARVALVTGGLVSTAGAVLVGLEGPRTAPLALACTSLFVIGWLLLQRTTPEAPT